MDLAVVGSGYVGLVAGACLAETGNTVVCVERDPERVRRLRANEMPLFEPGLEPLVRQNQEAGRLRLTTDLADGVAQASLVFIAVGTPTDADGSADLSAVLEVARQVAAMATSPLILALKSTVPVGTTARVQAMVREVTSVPIDVCANPEFLKEGAAVDDFMHPDRVIIGTESEAVRRVMAEVYAPYVRRGGDRIMFMDPASAEVTKYAANAMLATRVSFMNQVAAVCEAVGADVSLVRQGIGSDRRIGRAFLYAGPGFGGSCFPKDLRALVRTGREHGISMDLVEAVDAVNRRQRDLVFDKVRLAVGDLAGATVAVWGLAFKAETDDVRESPAVELVERLHSAGATVRAHDPKAMPSAARRLGDQVALVADPYAVLDGADALVVMTEWLIYRTPDLRRMARGMRRPVIIDARNLYDPRRVAEAGMVYHGIGRRQP